MLGFEPRADEHKVQWLSAPGKPRFVHVFRDLIFRGGGGWPQVNRSFFDGEWHAKGGFSGRLYDELGIKRDELLSPETKADLAASLQTAVHEAVVAMIGPAENVCIAGGLALNALLIHSLEEKFKNVFVQPVAGNAGTEYACGPPASATSVSTNMLPFGLRIDKPTRWSAGFVLVEFAARRKI